MSLFEEIIDRRNTHCVKWDTLESAYHEKDLLPMWIADMDFLALPTVRDAFKDYIDKGVFGYATTPDSLYQAIINWQKRRHHFTVTKEEILFNSGVVPSIALAVQAYTKVGEAVMIHDPVYPPFAQVVEKNQRQLIRSFLIEADQFQIDFAAMEETIVKNQVKLFILCNPHNPGGRLWSREELQRIGQICQKHQVIVVSDEIHQDIVYQPGAFTTFQNAGSDFASFSIVLTAATKTFNLAGIKNSMIFIKDPDLRKTFSELQQRNQQAEINTFGMIGTEVAYNTGDGWLDELLHYLKGNIDYVGKFLQQELPKVKFYQPDATYLMWLDFSAYGLSDEALAEKMIHQAKVVLNPGSSFGPQGSQHMRINLACPKATVVEGMQRIAQAFK